MDGLILLIILIPLTILILLFIIVGKSSSQQQALDLVNKKLNQLSDQLSDLNAEIKKIGKEKPPQFTAPEITGEKIQEILKPVIKPSDVPLEEKPAFIPEKKTTPSVEKAPPPPLLKKEPVIIETVFASKTEEPPEAEPSSFWNKNFNEKTDWEKFIGENLANKIGIAILVLGISFFVKFAIDKEWINETGRVIIGLVSGGILISLAHYTRNSYRSFSSVLVGGGLTVFYFTIAFAFHEYHLIGQQAAFIVMVVITAFAVLISLLYNRIELAILATAGGFITPFLVSTGQNNYVALFTYLCILNAGLLVLSWFKRWKAINIIALIFTVIIFGGWLLNQESGFVPYQWALFFSTIFYVQFVAMNIINNLKLKMKFGALDFILLLSINFLYYVAGTVTLDYLNDGEYKGLFTASLGVINLILAWLCFKQKQADRNFIYLLIGLTLTFISLAAPVQLKGNQITLFWAAEAVVLFWLYQRSRIVLLKIASPLIILLMLISLFMDWSQLYRDTSAVIPILANKGFITTIISATALLLYYRMMRKEADMLYLPGIENRLIRNILLSSGILLGYAAGAWEVYYQFSSRLPDTQIFAAYLQLYSYAFIIFILPFFKRSSSFILIKLMFTLTGVILYIFNLRVNYQISLQLLTTGRNSIHFIVHWLSAALLIWLLYDLIVYFRKQKIKVADYEAPFTWITASCLIFLFSVEMYYIFMWANYRNEPDWVNLENLYYKAGLSILWGFCSFAMMWLGMKHKFRALRIISLTLFTITLVKLFFFDIQNIPPGGKIAAFILLGVLLLIISFMYQRLKKIIIDDQQKA